MMQIGGKTVYAGSARFAPRETTPALLPDEKLVRKLPP
jgi:hypothetical protein